MYEKYSNEPMFKNELIVSNIVVLPVPFSPTKTIVSKGSPVIPFVKSSSKSPKRMLIPFDFLYFHVLIWLDVVFSKFVYNYSNKQTFCH